MHIGNKFRHLELNGCVKRNAGSKGRWRAGYCFRCDFRTKTGAKEMLSIKRDNIRFYPNLRFELKESLKRKRRGVCDRGLGIYEATDFDYLEDDEERSSTRFAIDG